MIGRMDDASSCSEYKFPRISRNLSKENCVGNLTATTGLSQSRIPPMKLNNKNAYVSIQRGINKENINVKKSLIRQMLSKFFRLVIIIIPNCLFKDLGMPKTQTTSKKNAHNLKQRKL